MRHPAAKLLTALITIVLLTSSAWAQEPDFQFKLEGFEGLGGPSGEPGLVYQSSFVIDPAQGVGELRLSIEMNDGWCVYSTTQPAGGPFPSKITLKPNPAVVTLGTFVPTSKPKIVPADKIFLVAQEKHYQKVEWIAPFVLASNVDPDQLEFEVIYKGQTCQDGGSCIQKNEKVIAKFAGEQSITLPADFKAPAAPVKLVPDNNYKITGKTGIYTTPRGHSLISGNISPPVVMPGEKVTITVSVSPTDAYHVYAYSKDDQPVDAEIKGYKPTLIVLSQDSQFKMSTPVTSKAVIEKAPGVEGFDVLRYHDGSTSWTFEVEIPKDAPHGNYPLIGYLGYQTCTDTTCDRPSGVQFETIIKVAPQSALGAAGLAFSEQAYSIASDIALSKQPAVEVQNDPEVAPIAAVDPGPAVEEAADLHSESAEKSEPANVSLAWILLLSFGGGMILNLMPCVLPVIGIKILSFVEQSGENRARAFMLNFIYSLGVMAVFMVLACLLAFAGMAWGQQSGDYRFIIPMTAVVFVFGLSMLDVWELSVPGFVGTGSASKAAQNDGYIGAFFKGSLATVLSTPCSGPLLGGVFALLMNKPPSIVFLSLGFIGLGMASPYLLIGVFPKLIRFLPKPGNWMNTFKHSMGFVMMLTAVYLLYTLNNQYVIATLTFLISLSVACWMIGKVTVSHSLISHLKAWGAAVTVVVITGVLSFNFLITGLEHEGWHRYSKHELAGMQRSINDMQSQGKTVMVDFTANWCGTCQTNFYFAINTEKVNEFAKKHGIERRIVDWSDTASDEAIYIEEFLEELGANSIPLLAIFPADQPGEVIILRDGLFESTVLENLRKVVPEEDLEELQVQHTASIPH